MTFNNQGFQDNGTKRHVEPPAEILTIGMLSHAAHRYSILLATGFQTIPSNRNMPFGKSKNVTPRVFSIRLICSGDAVGVLLLFLLILYLYFSSDLSSMSYTMAICAGIKSCFKSPFSDVLR